MSYKQYEEARTRAADLRIYWPHLSHADSFRMAGYALDIESNLSKATDEDLSWYDQWIGPVMREFAGQKEVTENKPTPVEVGKIVVIDEAQTPEEVGQTAVTGPDPFRHFVNDKFGDIRITDREGKPWAIANDVAKALGYKYPADAIRKHCKGVDEMATPTAGGVQAVKIIGLPDVMRLVMKSTLDEAEKFQDWWYEEVLPALYHTGHYSTEGHGPEVPQTMAEALRLAADLEEERLQLEATVEVQKPKVEVYDQLWAARDTVTFNEAAKIMHLKYGGIIFAEKLRLMGFLLTKPPYHNLPAQEHINAGRAVVLDQPYQDPNTGEWKARRAGRLTRKGIIYLLPTFKDDVAENMKPVTAEQLPLKLAADV